MRAIILEQQLWWADLHLGEAGPPPQQSRDKTAIVLVLRGWGKAGPPWAACLEAQSPENWGKAASPSGAQLKEDGHPRLVTEHLPAHEGRQSAESRG